MDKLYKTKVALFGLGGVGSWCAEALIRSGIQNLMMVDSDHICISNVNRQLQATSQNIGCSKVTELETRLKSINPEAHIKGVQKIYDYQSRPDFPLEEYDYVIDAIDTLSAKIELILHAHGKNRILFSAMGAACRLDPLRIKVDSIWNTTGCGLSRVVRKKLRKKNFEKDFLCVYSDETLKNEGHEESCGDVDSPFSIPEEGKANAGESLDERFPKKQINGSLVHMTGIYGFMLASLVVKDVVRKSEK